MRTPLTAAVVASLVAIACGAPSTAGEALARVSAATTVGGCTCPTSGNCAALTFSNVPANATYYVTTFGGGSDTQSMACGGTADGTWAYVADEARFGCGAKLLISANGKSCVAQVADCGPNQCVEQAAANDSCATNFPIIDASPFITSYLLGITSSGWSDHNQITAVQIDGSSTAGCPGVPVGVTPADAGSGSGSGSGSSSGSGGSSGSSSGSSSGGGSGGGDAGGGSSSGGATVDAAVTADAGAEGGSGASGAYPLTGDGGGCSVTSGGGDDAAGLAFLGLGLLLVRRRRA